MNPKQTSVLIVDDDPLFRQSLRIVLNQMPQAWHCYEAESVHEAIIRLAQHSISLAIVDIHLTIHRHIIAARDSFPGKLRPKSA